MSFGVHPQTDKSQEKREIGNSRLTPGRMERPGFAYNKQFIEAGDSIGGLPTESTVIRI